MKKNIVLLFVVFLIANACKKDPRGNTTADREDLNRDSIIQSLIKEKKSIGTGTLDISFNNPVPLYRSENDKKPFDTLYFNYQTNGVLTYDTKYLKLYLKPYRMEGGDSDAEAINNINSGLIRFPVELKFRVLELTNNYYKIVLNESTFVTAIVYRNPSYAILSRAGLFAPELPKNKEYEGYYVYEEWCTLLLRAEFLTLSEGAVIYDKPNGEIVFENKENEFLPYKAVEVEGDWIKITKGFGREFNFDNIENAEGWTKWNDGKTILVNIVEYTVE